MRVELELTAENLSRGVRKSFDRCPLALSVKDRFPDAEDVMVSWKGVNFRLGAEHWFYHTARGSAVRRVVNGFDFGRRRLQPERLAFEMYAG